MPFNKELEALYDINLEYNRDGMHVFLQANIVGGPSSHKDMHCEWYEINWGEEFNFSGGPDCAAYEEGMLFPRSHRYDYVFSNPGDTEITFRYGQLRPISIEVHLDPNTSSN